MDRFIAWLMIQTNRPDGIGNIARMLYRTKRYVYNAGYSYEEMADMFDHMKIFSLNDVGYFKDAHVEYMNYTLSLEYKDDRP